MKGGLLETCQLVDYTISKCIPSLVLEHDMCMPGKVKNDDEMCFNSSTVMCRDVTKSRAGALRSDDEPNLNPL